MGKLSTNKVIIVLMAFLVVFGFQNCGESRNGVVDNQSQEQSNIDYSQYRENMAILGSIGLNGSDADELPKRTMDQLKANQTDDKAERPFDLKPGQKGFLSAEYFYDLHFHALSMSKNERWANKLVELHESRNVKTLRKLIRDVYRSDVHKKLKMSNREYVSSIYKAVRDRKAKNYAETRDSWVKRLDDKKITRDELLERVLFYPSTRQLHADVLADIK